MCLSVVLPEGLRIGYKYISPVFNKPGVYTGPYNPIEEYKAGTWVTAKPGVTTIKAVDNIRYPAGFHIYTAVPNLSICNNLALVLYSHVVATGIQNLRSVDVAKKMCVVKILSKTEFDKNVPQYDIGRLVKNWMRRHRG